MLLSIGVIAYNEADSVGRTIKSLLDQNIFDWLRSNNESAEIVCIANGCSDNTAAVARTSMDECIAKLNLTNVINGRVVDVQQKGKTNALNIYYRHESNQNAKYKILADADILLNNNSVLMGMVKALIDDGDAHVAVSLPIKDILSKQKKSILDYISLATSRVTKLQPGQISGQLYCIRGEVANNVYFPNGLLMDDGFLKVMICTDFMTKTLNQNRIVYGTNASHTFEAYTSIKDILNNQKRQVIGQTMVHLLVDRFLPGMSYHKPEEVGSLLRKKDEEDPFWFPVYVREYVSMLRNPFKLHPGIISHRFKRLSKLSFWRRFLHLPVAIIGAIVSCIAATRAYLEIRRGGSNYWPDTRNIRI